MINWKKMPLGALQTNGYIIYNAEREGVVIDPGGDADVLFQWIASKHIKVTAILLTHAHFDHIGALQAVREKYNCPVYIHREESGWLTDPAQNGSGLFPGIEPVTCRPAEYFYSGEGVQSIGGFEFRLLETPGHSPGSVSFYFPEDKVIFSGDVLFHGGVGRTDLPGGNQETLMAVIHEKMLTLPDDTVVANGHGPETTIGKEKEINPFINGFGW